MKSEVWLATVYRGKHNCLACHPCSIELVQIAKLALLLLDGDF